MPACATPNLPPMIGRVPFFDGDERAAAGIANFSICNEFGLDGRSVFGRVDDSSP